LDNDASRHSPAVDVKRAGHSRHGLEGHAPVPAGTGRAGECDPRDQRVTSLKDLHGAGLHQDHGRDPCLNAPARHAALPLTSEPPRSTTSEAAGAPDATTGKARRRFCGRQSVVTSRAGRDGVPGSHDGHDGTDGPAVRHSPEAERRHRRPNTAPAYYLGHPAALWITVMRPHRRPATASEVWPLRAASGPYR